MDFSGKRVLIIKPSSLGDVVHTLPLAHAIKRCRPSCRIGWVIQRGFRSILEGDPAIDEIIPIDIPSTSDPHAQRGAYFAAASATLRAISKLRRRFRQAPYDLVLDLHASFRSGLLAMTHPGGIRIGFADAKELNPWFQHQTVAPAPGCEHAVDKNLAFARYLGCEVISDDFRMHVAAEAREFVRDYLREHRVADNGRIIYANAAARWETKLWTIEAWAELADLLIEKSRATVVFGGSRADAPYFSKITERMKHTPLVTAGRFSLAQSVALIAASSAYVGVDSGPMHIAAFTGTRVIALFGPTDPAKVGPYGSGHRVIRLRELDCLACRKRACDDRKCLEGIAPQRVFEETMELLGWDVSGQA